MINTKKEEKEEREKRTKGRKGHKDKRTNRNKRTRKRMHEYSFHDRILIYIKVLKKNCDLCKHFAQKLTGLVISYLFFRIMVTLFLTNTLYNLHYHQNLKFEMKLKNVFFFIKRLWHIHHIS